MNDLDNSRPRDGLTAPAHNSKIFIKSAVAQHKAASHQGLLERLFARWFDGLVYTQIWEDPRVDRQALQLDAGSRVMTISSAGCNVMNYLIDGPQKIYAVDFNRHHIYLTALKMAALKHLPSQQAFYDFCGLASQRGNVENYYRHIEPNLDTALRQYWSGKSGFNRPRIRLFSNNLYQYGTTGYFIRMLHTWVKAGGRRPESLLRAGNRLQQQSVYRREIEPFFETLPVKLAGRLPFILYSLGIPPRQFNGLKNASRGNLVSLYRERIRRLACDFPITDNYFAWQAFGRRYDHQRKDAIPDYLAPAHYDTIRSRLNRVRLHIDTLHRFLKSMPDQSLNRYVLLDSQDWMDTAQIRALWREIDRTAMPGSRIIFRAAASNAHVASAISNGLKRRFVYQRELSEALSRQDRAAIYGGFFLYCTPV